MNPVPTTQPNLKQAVPFFGVTDIVASARFYVAGLGFTITKQWSPEGKLRWCWLEREGVALMLQEYLPEHRPTEKLGVGASVCFICEDALALYREFTARGLAVTRPFVGNGMWVISLTDPDGYKLDFESYTDAPEESEYSEEGDGSIKTESFSATN